MTVNTTNITSGPYPGNDITTEFSYGFRVANKTQLSVYETDDLGVQTLLVVDTDYTVAGVGVDAGGLVTRLAGALPTNYSWYIRSNYIENQLTAFASQGGFLPDVHEAQMDHITFLIQQMRDTLNRSFALSDTIDLDGDFIMEDDAAVRASKRLGFDASGNLIVVSAVDGTVSVTPFMETLLDDTTAAAGRATLIAAGLTDNNTFSGVNTFTKIQKWAKGADIATAVFDNRLTPGTDGNYFDVTSTIGIEIINSLSAGSVIKLHFDGICPIRHHAAFIILPAGVDITTVPGDELEFIMNDDDTWRLINYQSKINKISDFVNASDGSCALSAIPIDIDSTLTEAAWESIGPTGSGADNIWTALDGVPTDIDWIEVRLNFRGVGGAASSLVQAWVYARANGSSSGTTEKNLITELDGYADSGGNVSTSVNALVKIPVASKVFDASWTSAFSTDDIKMFLTGYGYNS